MQALSLSPFLLQVFKQETSHPDYCYDPQVVPYRGMDVVLCS
jgi:hypothetical protein